MATKLKKMALTSVDLVRAGANQEADICLYKSADATEQPTESEKNIFKRFLRWVRENPSDDDTEPTETAETTETVNEQLYAPEIYKDAITESIQSIITDDTLSAEEKSAMVEKSIEQYHSKMVEHSEDNTPSSETVTKTDIEEIEEVQKFNPYHGRDGRFTSANGGGGGGTMTLSSGMTVDRKAMMELANYVNGGGGASGKAKIKADIARIDAELKNGVKDPKRRSFLEATKRRYEKELNPPKKFEVDLDNLDEVGKSNIDHIEEVPSEKK